VTKPDAREIINMMREIINAMKPRTHKQHRIVVVPVDISGMWTPRIALRLDNSFPELKLFTCMKDRSE
jgi:hypothetical protein